MIESVPLIQNANDAQQINASIIAMKKASKELDEKILKLNNLNKELDKKLAVLDNGLAQEITDRENADNAEVTNRNTAITNAVNSLDVASVGGSGKYISAISETDGKISATVSELTSVIESGNNQPATSGGVASAISYDFSHYESREESIFVITVPYLNNNNSTDAGSILINARYGYRYILDFYAFINESRLSNTADRIARIRVLEGAYASGNYLESKLKWDIDTTNKKIKFYLKKNSSNTRINFKVLQNYNSVSDVTFSVITDVSVWNNAQYSSDFEYLSPIDSVTDGSLRPITSNAVYNFNKITIDNSTVGETKDFYILLNPTAVNSYNRVGSYEFHIIIQRAGISNSKNIIINFLSSYEGVEGQNILQCGIREGVTSIFAKIVKITYDGVSYFALKVKVYDWSKDEIYYKYEVSRYSSNLLFKIVNSSDISNESDVSYISLYQNGTLL